MKIGVEELKQVVELLEAADEFKPVVTAVIEKSVEFLKELSTPIEEFRKYTIENRLLSIKQITDAGYTVEQAIFITTDERISLKNGLKDMNKK